MTTFHLAKIAELKTWQAKHSPDAPACPANKEPLLNPMGSA